MGWVEELLIRMDCDGSDVPEQCQPVFPHCTSVCTGCVCVRTRFISTYNPSCYPRVGANPTRLESTRMGTLTSEEGEGEEGSPPSSSFPRTLCKQQHDHFYSSVKQNVRIVARREKGRVYMILSPSSSSSSLYLQWIE